MARRLPRASRARSVSAVQNPLPPPRFGVSDVLAGISVAFLLIPQSMAYAELAGVPPYVGLYAAVLPLIAAAFFASSPYLQTGPAALTSLLTFGALAPIASPDSSHYVPLAALLAVVVGATRVAIGAGRFGWIAYMMSQPVLKGFTTAAAILIIASQMPTALGAVAPQGGLVGRAIWALAQPSEWDLTALGLSVVAIALVRAGPRVHPLFPGVLIAALVGLAVGWVGDYGGATVGEVPTGLPPISLSLPWGDLPALLVPGLVIAVVGFAEPAAIARTLAARARQTWDPDREFVSQGVASLAAGLSGAFPVGGSFGRTTLNQLAGGRTRWSGAVTGVVVGLFLFRADLVSRLPMAVLGAIVIGAVISLVDFKSLVQLTRMSAPQGAVAWGTFGLTLILSPRVDQAVIIGVGMAVLVHLWRERGLHVQAEYAGETLRIRPHGVLFFASAPWLDQTLVAQLAAHPEAAQLEIDLSRLGRIDYTGAMALKDVAVGARSAGLTVRLVGVPPHAKQILRRVLGEEEIGATS